ncbi:hypothetical protein ACFL0J_00065 [Candidatus Neomarinimicrobiota bacterium]
MKYLTYLMSLLLVLAFVGCNKTKEAPVDETTEAVEKVVVDTTVVEEALEMIE